MSSHILLLGLQADLAARLERPLTQAGYRISQSNPQDLSTVQRLNPDVIIMGLLTPDHEGVEPCRYLAMVMPKTPIMVLGHDGMEERINQLNVCANDYLPLPFAMEEFLARVRAKLRRVRWEKTDVVLTFADLRLDPQTYEVHYGDRLIDLTAKEFDLLKYLMANPRQVLTHQQILDAVWPDAALKDGGNVLHVYIRYLRRKLKSADALIQTVRGIGYALSASQTRSVASSSTSSPALAS